MPIVGHGVDLVETARIEQMLAEHGDRFLERCFTHHERTTAEPDNRRRFEHLAARFAAKEAAMKALGTGLADGISWTDVEVFRTPTGAPELRVTGRAHEIARARGIHRWHVSLSHTDNAAMASVIAESD
ncbi:MAG: holo-ACP synthase [Phycisphaeraceae bacterium]|nr:holo-ACP synthase [Phycisphaeraceae bacterium]